MIDDDPRPDEAPTLLESPDSQATDPIHHPRDSAPLPPRLGRYVVVEEVGAGGMGRVLRAYDPKLRREVALKLLTAVADAQGAARIVREAQAMARLSHPNLVPVYDVEHDEHDGESVFIAMEYVEGETLREWLAARPRSWREVLAMLVAAGEGLAAAHAAGIVHRDFKPSNAIVGTDGRVRVMDFGLARGVAFETNDTGVVPSALDTLTELTLAGTVLGTAPYMAPEQHRGEPVVPASDQFGFCVALYEGLFGVRPFAGRDLRALLGAKLGAAPTASTRGPREVPQWLRTAVLRGLAADPDSRWPSMRALLTTLGRGQARAHRRRMAVITGALALATTAIVVGRWLGTRATRSACESAGASIGEAWNDRVKAELHAGLVSTGISYATTTADKVMPWMDLRAAAWQDARTDVCLAAEVEGTLDPDALDRALWCLDERRMEFEALVAALSQADAANVQRAVGAAAGLSPADVCRDADALERQPPPPPDALRGEVRVLRAELSRADALYRAGSPEPALAIAQSVRERASAVAWPPLLVTALLLESSVHLRAGAYDPGEQAGIEAYFAAAHIGAWDLAADAAINVGYVVGEATSHPAEGRWWLRHAEVAIDHAGDARGLRDARRIGVLANLNLAAGDYADALALNEQSLALWVTAVGPEHPTVGSGLQNLASVHMAKGDYVLAQSLFEQAVAIFHDSFGADHPEFARGLLGMGTVLRLTGDSQGAAASCERARVILDNALGVDHPDPAKALVCAANAYFNAGDHAKAREYLERALVTLERVFGPDHADVARTLTNLASVLAAANELTEAAALFERALAIEEKTLGTEHVEVATALSNLATVLTARKDHQKARALLERALVIHERAVGPRHRNVALVLYNLAAVDEATGNLDSARALLERALPIFEQLPRGSHPDSADTITRLAAVALLADDPTTAVRLAERALTLYDQHDDGYDDELLARFTLARALVDSGGDRIRAGKLAAQAREGWRAGKGMSRPDLPEVERWIADHLSP